MKQKIMVGTAGLFLFPAAAGLGLAMYQTLTELFMDPVSTRTINAFLAGSGLWIMLFLIFPRPIRSYILAHELSHLLAAWLSGVKGGKLKVGREGGSVEVEKSTLWIALAPYLIPFYTLLVLTVYFMAQLWWDPKNWALWLPLALGLTWSYHLTFTLYTLSVPQSDIHPYGRLGAYSIILCGNLLWLYLALVFLNPLPGSTDLKILWDFLIKSYRFSFHQLREIYTHIKNTIIRG